MIAYCLLPIAYCWLAHAGFFTQRRRDAKKYICSRKDNERLAHADFSRRGAETQRNTFACAKRLTHAKISRRGAETQRNTFAYAKTKSGCTPTQHSSFIIQNSSFRILPTIHLLTLLPFWNLEFAYLEFPPHIFVRSLIPIEDENENAPNRVRLCPWFYHTYRRCSTGATYG
jgi:hypothetical protein